MKKILAMLLAVVCLFSILTVGLTAAAAGGEADPIYAIVYSKGGVPVMYLPAPTFRFDGPGWLTVTEEKPTAVGYDFVCWEDENGNRVYPGDQIYVDKEVKLMPVFAKSTSNDDRTTSTIKAAFQSLIAVFERLFKFFRELEIFNFG